MVRLTRLNHVPLILNSDLIEHIEETPDTVITLTTGQILRVREPAEQVVNRIVAYLRRIHGPDAPLARLKEENDTAVGNPWQRLPVRRSPQRARSARRASRTWPHGPGW